MTDGIECSTITPVSGWQEGKAMARAVQNITRHSQVFPSLILELQASDRGLFLTFKKGGAWDCYSLIDGIAVLCDCSDRVAMSTLEAHHCRKVAEAYARKFAPRRRAA